MKTKATVILNRSLPPRLVTEGGDSLPLRFAAEELRRYLDRILGTTGAPVGNRAPVIRLCVDPESGLAEDEFELAADREGLVIRGAAGRAVLTGVYELLRRFGGCCFSGPAPLGEYVPRKETLEIGPLPLRVKPKFRHRDLQLYWKTDPELTLARIDWMTKNGYNSIAYNVCADSKPALKGGGALDPATREQREQQEERFTETVFDTRLLPAIRQRGIKLHAYGHNLLNFLPPDRYFAQHPEWYALKDGKRMPGGPQLCLCTSNPDMIREFSNNAAAFLKSHPDVEILGVGPQDGSDGGCECAECRAMDDHPDDVFKPGKHFRSPEGENPGKIRRYAKFVNAVAQVVRREYPDRRLSYQGYVDLNFPPRGVRLADNVMIHYSLYWRCGAHSFDQSACPANRFMADTLERWLCEYPGRVFVADNAFEGMFAQRSLPYPIDEVLMENWNLFHALGVDGMIAQFGDARYLAYALNYFVFGRVCWDDAAGNEDVLDEFLRGMFGGAGRALRPIYESFHQTIRNIRARGKAYSVFLWEQPKWKTIYPEKLEACLEPTAANVVCFLDDLGGARLAECLAEAGRLAADDRERAQVQAFTDLAGYWRRAADFFRRYWPAEVQPDMAPDTRRAAMKKSCAAGREIVEYLKRVVPRREGWMPASLPGRWERLLQQVETQVAE